MVSTGAITVRWTSPGLPRENQKFTSNMHCVSFIFLKETEREQLQLQTVCC